MPKAFEDLLRNLGAASTHSLLRIRCHSVGFVPVGYVPWRGIAQHKKYISVSCSRSNWIIGHVIRWNYLHYYRYYFSFWLILAPRVCFTRCRDCLQFPIIIRITTVIMESPSVVNCIPFPVPRSPDLSIISTRMTALDVCNSVYGEGGSDTVDNYYEPNASMCPYILLVSYLLRFYSVSTRYFQIDF